MAIDVKGILRAGMAVQSVSLLSDNVSSARLALKKQKSKDQGMKRIVKTGVNNIVGISLIKEQGRLIYLV